MLTRTEILGLASNRMRKGAKKHGPWNPRTDTRDLDSEIVDEYVDIINYCIMQIQKISLLKNERSKHKKIRKSQNHSDTRI